MAKSQLLPVLALSLTLTLIGIALAHDPITGIIGEALKTELILQGRVYCDTCRAGFETDLTTYMPDAKVRLECVRYGTDELTYKAEVTTGPLGVYQITVPDDHSNDQCSVVLVKSSANKCNEVQPGRDRVRVVLSQDGGLLSGIRQANPLGFLINEPMPACGKMLQKYGFANDDN